VEGQSVSNKMLFATLLLTINFIALIYNGVVLFNFWWFLLIYPIEILLYIIFWFVLLLIGVAITK